MKRILAFAAKAAVPVLLLTAVGCDGTGKTIIPVPNQKPEVRLTSAPVSSVKSDSVYYAYRLNWVGYDPDGRVDHYLYAIDPAAVDVVDSTWLSTRNNEEFLLFRARTPDRLTPGLATATELHVFAIRAVDNQGQMSEPTSRAFFSWTQAPEVTITDPNFSNVNTPIVPPSVRILWDGRDDDGVFTQKPIKYKFRLFPSGPTPPDFPFPVNEADFHQFMLSHPDSFRKGYAPLFAGWDSSSADTTEVQYTGLIANKHYYFVVTGFDEAGAYDPVFNVNKNMMKFYVNFATQSAPKITLFNEFFNYTYSQGGYIRNPLRYIVIEVPAGEAITFNWRMTPAIGSQPKRFRWVMDLVDLDDETARTDETTDWYHWSQWGLTNTSATVGPFAGGEEHLFYVAAEDNNSLVSLGIVSFTSVQASLDLPLLIVDDTRFLVDSRSPGPGGQLLPPGGEWPTAAELDTFMYALGNFQWKSYPVGTMSPRGIFAGYDFDTLGTRGMRDPVVPLSILGRYAHVVWMTDQTAGNNTDSPFSSKPVSSLREMNNQNKPNTLATYMIQGGNVWMFGGGIARAAQAEWENPQGQNSNFSFRDGELVPGRMLFDFVHWQNEVVGGSTTNEARRGARMVDPATQQTRVDPPGRGWAGQPDYSRLPPLLQRKGIAPADPVPPYNRTASQFYVSQFTSEYVTNSGNSTPNIIREDVNGPAPGGVESTLDTLYHMVSSSGGGFWATMTYYHGLETDKPVIMSGFPIWAFKRDQAKGLVDFVLTDLWQIPLRPDPVRANLAASPEGTASRSASSPATVPALQRSALRTIPLNRPTN